MQSEPQPCETPRVLDASLESDCATLYAVLGLDITVRLAAIDCQCLLFMGDARAGRSMTDWFLLRCGAGQRGRHQGSLSPACKGE
jgi:hypothetical protein